jgi:Tol biopolymer transport system component
VAAHQLYVLTPSFTPDQSAVVFASNRSGQAQFYRAGFPDGPIVQLTDGDPVHGFSGVIAPDGETLYFTRSGAVVALNLSDLSERTLAHFEGAGLGEVDLSADGAWIVSAIKVDGENGIVVAAADGTTAEIIHRQDRTIIHPQFHPTDTSLIEYAADPAPRMFLIGRDGSDNRSLFEHDNDYFIVHETWLGDTGDLVFTVWPYAVKRMRLPSRDVETIASFNAWHIAPSRDGGRILCDTNHPDIGMQLIDTATGDMKTVCHPGASNGGSQWATSRYALEADFEAAARAGASDRGKALSWMEMKTDTVYGPQYTHPHPSFSPDERWVCFTSDRSGSPQVYVAELPA